MSRFLGWYTHWASSGHAPALVRHGHVMDYAALLDDVDRLARRMQAHGCSTGSRVLMDVPSGGFEWVVALLAGLQAGCGVILLDPHMSAGERLDCLDELHPAFAVRAGGAVDRIGKPAGAAVEGPGIWLFTSGTTARPRPHFRSDAALARQVERVGARLPDTLSACRPTSLNVSPLYHGYGLLNALLLTHSLGGTVILAEDEADATLVSMLHERDVRLFYAWPSHFERLATQTNWPRHPAATLAWCVSSSTRLDPHIAARFSDLSGCVVRQQYGTTETGPLCVDSNPMPGGSHCMGRPLDGVKIEIVDAAGRIAPAGQEGQVAVVLSEPTDPEALRHRRYFPGDRGLLDAAGQLHVLRRAQPFFDERKTS